MEKLENSRSGKITNGSKSKKILLRFKLTKCIINLLRTLGTSYYLKSTGRYNVKTQERLIARFTKAAYFSRRN